MKQSLVNRLLVLRFFTGLKTRQPKLFYFCLTLTAMQLLCTAAKLEITPFVLYGMYSEKYAPTATLSRHQVLVDGQPVSTLNLHFREKMYLQTIAENYLLQWQNGGIDPLQTRVENRYPFFTNSPIYPFASRRIYNMPTDVKAFEQWFKEKNKPHVQDSNPRISIVRQTFQVLPHSLPVKLVRVDTLRQF